MALIRDFTQKHMERPSLHDENEASYSVFERDGRVLLQSHGSGWGARGNAWQEEPDSIRSRRC